MGRKLQTAVAGLVLLLLPCVFGTTVKVTGTGLPITVTGSLEPQHDDPETPKVLMPVAAPVTAISVKVSFEHTGNVRNSAIYLRIYPENTQLYLRNILLADWAGCTTSKTAEDLHFVDGAAPPACVEPMTGDVAPEESLSAAVSGLSGPLRFALVFENGAEYMDLMVTEWEVEVTVASGSEGDPHFVGFRGQRYDINGEPGKVYNWYSDSDIQINGEMMLHPESKQMYMAAVGLRLGPNVQLRFRPEPHYDLSVLPFHGNGTLDDCGRYFWDESRQLIVQWQTYTIVIRRMTPLAGSRKIQYLDLFMSNSARNPATVEGLLGASHRPSTPVLGSYSGEGVLTAGLEQYIVKDGLLGTKFVFNQFNATAGLLSPAECSLLLKSPKSAAAAIGAMAGSTGTTPLNPSPSATA